MKTVINIIFGTALLTFFLSIIAMFIKDMTEIHTWLYSFKLDEILLRVVFISGIIMFISFALMGVIN